MTQAAAGLLAAVSALCAVAAASAQTLPPAGFFSGTYELTGRSPGTGGRPLSDIVDITSDGQMAILHACRLGDGHLSPTTSDREGTDPLKGALGDLKLSCRYLVDGDNYGRLSCIAIPDGETDAPGLISLWPLNWPVPTHLADCD